MKRITCGFTAVLLSLSLLLVPMAPVHASEASVYQGVSGVTAQIRNGTYDKGFTFNNGDQQIAKSMIDSLFMENLNFYLIADSSVDMETGTRKNYYGNTNSIVKGAFRPLTVSSTGYAVCDFSIDKIPLRSVSSISYNPSCRTLFYTASGTEYYIINRAVTSFVTYRVKRNDDGSIKSADIYVRCFVDPVTGTRSSYVSTADSILKAYPQKQYTSTQSVPVPGMENASVYFTSGNVSSVTCGKTLPDNADVSSVHIITDGETVTGIKQVQSDGTWADIDAYVNQDEAWSNLVGHSAPDPDPPVPSEPVDILEMANTALAFSVSILTVASKNPVFAIILAGSLITVCIYVLRQIKTTARSN